MTDVWVEELASELGVDGLSQEEISKLLAAARDVAHGVERRITPLSAFLVGAAVERRMAAGAVRRDAFREVLATLEAQIPDAEPEEIP